MAWIESHQELGRHPKTRRLAKLLDTSRPTAVGHLQYLWWWALDFAQGGDLSSFDDEEIAEAALWDDDPGTFVSALKGAGFMDPDGRLHDWNEYAGRLIDKREQAKERVRNWRAKRTENTPNSDTDGNDNATHNKRIRNATTAQNSTEQHTTQQDSTEQSGNTRDGREEQGRAAPPSLDQYAGIDFQQFDALRRQDYPEELIVAAKRQVDLREPGKKVQRWDKYLLPILEDMQRLAEHGATNHAETNGVPAKESPTDYAIRMAREAGKVA